MKTCAIMALMAVAGATGAVNAQPLGTATYSLQFSNGLNTITLGPGQSTTVSVFVSFNPGLGAWYLSGPHFTGQVLGLNYGGFSITGTPSGGNPTGSFSLLPGPGHPSLVSPYNFLPGLATMPGTSAGLGHNGVLWGHDFLFTPVHPLPENPGKVWTGIFTINPGSTPGQINLAFAGLTATGIDVSLGPIANMAIPLVADFVSNPGVGGTIFVPSPASLGLLGFAGLGAMSRRRLASGPRGD